MDIDPAAPRPHRPSGASAPPGTTRARPALAPLSRRRLIQGAAGGALVWGATPPSLAWSAGARPAAVADVPVVGDTHWLGPDLWGNRLADWVVRAGAIICVAPVGKRHLCTASVLTRRLTGAAATISVTLWTGEAGRGFAGLLVGTGTDEEHRRTALVATSSGTGGGLLAVVGDDAVVRFRDHVDEVNQFTYAVLPAQQVPRKRALRPGERVVLRLDVIPEQGPPGSGLVTLVLTALDAGGVQLSRATKSGVDADLVTGGIALASSATATTGPRYSFTDLLAEGDGIQVDSDRGLGPIFGTLFSLSAATLKMTAQVCPLDPVAGDEVILECLDPNGTWVVRTTAAVGTGYAAALRVEGWDASTATPYRVTHSRGGSSWTGTIPAEPGADRPVRIATISCSMAGFRGIDRKTPVDEGLNGDAPPLLYSAANIWFPYEDCMGAIAAQQPDLLVAMGDQYYEGSPTAKDPSRTPDLDFLYKYLIWLWAVRDLAKDRPTLVLVDDHDVFQGNLWGEGGVAAPGGVFAKGGYVNAASWVNLVQCVQCGHNPDPVDPAPVAQGMNVYFTRFDYAGITFVILEDRKFLTSSDGVQGNPNAPFEMLGPRQEAMLSALADEKHGSGLPVVVLTQTVYAAVQTNAAGRLMSTFAPTAFPRAPRDRALGTIKRAGAVMLSGDTHLAHLVRHLALPTGTGPMQFTGPAVASATQHWFTPSPPLPEAGVQPHTGHVVDPTGAEYYVHAVANPRVEQGPVVARPASHLVGDRSLKSEGYGMLVVDRTARTYRFEAWPGSLDPLGPTARPYPGWPFTMSFDEA